MKREKERERKRMLYFMIFYDINKASNNYRHNIEISLSIYEELKITIND